MNEQEKWLEYLSNLSSPNKELANKLWNKLKEHFPNIPIPLAGPFHCNDDNFFQFAWDKNEHHLEIDIYEYELDWFYRNRESDTYAGSDCLLYASDLNKYPDLTRHIKKIINE